MHVELEVFTECVQGTGYASLYLDAVEKVLEDVFDDREDLLCRHLNKVAVCFHQRPYFVGKGENNVPVRNPEKMAAHPLCPIFSQSPAAGRAQAAVAAVVDDFLLTALWALISDISLAWIVAEEHCLYGIALVLGKGSLICLKEVNKNVVFQERFVVFAYNFFSGDNL